jgi:hypothetical protein
MLTGSACRAISLGPGLVRTNAPMSSCSGSLTIGANGKPYLWGVVHSERCVRVQYLVLAIPLLSYRFSQPIFRIILGTISCGNVLRFSRTSVTRQGISS